MQSNHNNAIHSIPKKEDTQPAMVTSHAFSSTGDVITGDSNGSILVWTKDQDYVFKINKDMIGGMKAAHMVRRKTVLQYKSCKTLVVSYSCSAF